MSVWQKLSCKNPILNFNTFIVTYFLIRALKFLPVSIYISKKKQTFLLKQIFVPLQCPQSCWSERVTRSLACSWRTGTPPTSSGSASRTRKPKRPKTFASNSIFHFIWWEWSNFAFLQFLKTSFNIASILQFSLHFSHFIT